MAIQEHDQTGLASDESVEIDILDLEQTVLSEHKT